MANQNKSIWGSKPPGFVSVFLSWQAHFQNGRFGTLSWICNTMGPLNKRKETAAASPLRSRKRQLRLQRQQGSNIFGGQPASLDGQPLHFSLDLFCPLTLGSLCLGNLCNSLYSSQVLVPGSVRHGLACLGARLWQDTCDCAGIWIVFWGPRPVSVQPPCTFMHAFKCKYACMSKAKSVKTIPKSVSSLQTPLCRRNHVYV